MATRLGVKLERFRKRHDLTQVQLAEKAGLSQAYIAQLEEGDRTPSLATLKRLAKALQVNLAELLE